MIITNLLTNMVVLTIYNEIPTNAPALRDYVYDVLFAEAKAISERLHLDQTIIRKEKISRYEITPYLGGPSATLVFCDRYGFGTSLGNGVSFSDSAYHRLSVLPRLPGTNAADSQRIVGEVRNVFLNLQHSTNLLNLKTAQGIAKASMLTFGVDATKLRDFRTPKEAVQMKWRDDTFTHFAEDGRVEYRKTSGAIEYSLPYYNFSWENRWPRAICDVEVSGISSNVVYFNYLGPGAVQLKPTNYFELLGLSTNSVFVRRKAGAVATYTVVEP